MSEDILRIATRKSQLALWQAHYVSNMLQHHHPDLKIELVTMTTQGDKILDTPLSKVGGKGLFVKELETGMLEGRADIAVHSMKDVPVEFPEGLHLPVICEREDPRDAFVSNNFTSLEELPQGARLGTSSLRRQSQIAAIRPDLKIVDLRGNVNTRLQKLDDGEYDAIILAAAGLKRLEFEDRITQFIGTDICLPAIGQGAVGIECRSDDERVNRLIAPLNDHKTQIRVLAERAMNARLQGGCQVPIAGYAEYEQGLIMLRGLVAQVDGKKIIRGDIAGPPENAEELGLVLAEDLLSRGADIILQELYAKS